MENKKFTNEDRTRYYGLRIGDLIRVRSLNGTEWGRSRVIDFVPLDNNKVIIEDQNGNHIEWVAEWCEIIEKVEDKKDITDIQLIQKPEFRHELMALGASIKERLEGLNLPAMVANEDTIQTLKKLHADFNKEEKQIEENFKAAITQVTDVIDEIKEVKKEHINNVYSWGRGILKDEISTFEIKIKTAKKKEVVDYFDELCAAEKIDFLKWEHLKIEINLSTTVKNYIDQVHAYVMRVGDDLILINSLDFAAEMLTEYKSNGFNASAAISKVKERKQKEKEEAERILLAKIERREAKLRTLAMVHNDMLKTFNFVGDENIFITQQEISGLSDDEFMKLFVQVEAKIKVKNEENKPKPTLNAPPQSTNIGLFTTPTVSIPQPLTPPVEVEHTVEVRKQPARFEVWLTPAEGKLLKEFFIKNNLTYTNLKKDQL